MHRCTNTQGARETRVAWGGGGGRGEWYQGTAQERKQQAFKVIAWTPILRQGQRSGPALGT